MRIINYKFCAVILLINVFALFFSGIATHQLIPCLAAILMGLCFVAGMGLAHEILIEEANQSKKRV